MAIITIAAPLSGIRGKVGGVIYSANKAGPYLKAWGRGSNPRTEPQTSHRATLVQFSQSWAAISAANKTNWNTYAALPAQDKTNSLGETFSVSGFAWFVALNINREAVGLAQQDTAPTVAVPGTPTIQEVTFFTTGSASVSLVRLTVGSSGLTDDLAIYVKIVNSQGVGVASEVRAHMTTETPNVNRAIALEPFIEDVFGTTQLGQKLFIEVATQNTDGRQGARASDSAEAQTN